MKSFATAAALSAAALLSLAGPALADPGDVHRVTGERVNLRSAPSDDANIRGTVEQGERLVEIRREGNWIGVRAESSGAEGWVFQDLVKMAAPSNLGGAEPVRTAGFGSLSPGFDTMLAEISNQMGMRLFERVEQTGEGALRLVPTREFLRDGTKESHMLAALAVQQMWKNHQNGRPVSVAMLGEGGRSYLDLDDRGPNGPALTLDVPRTAAR